jgi:hypothetical protein
MERFSDFADVRKVLDGDKIRIESVLNQEVTVLGYRVAKGKHKTERCLTLQIEVDGGRRVVFTGSEVLISQMEQYGSRCPFVATIRRIGNYLTLS